jgi:hypothetical protein
MKDSDPLFAFGSFYFDASAPLLTFGQAMHQL